MSQLTEPVRSNQSPDANKKQQLDPQTQQTRAKLATQQNSPRYRGSSPNIVSRSPSPLGPINDRNIRKQPRTQNIKRVNFSSKTLKDGSSQTKLLGDLSHNDYNHSALMKEVKESRIDNTLDEMMFKNSKQFINKVKQPINLLGLYEIVDSCNYNTTEEFCPIILKLGKDLKTKVYNQDVAQSVFNIKDYLLQVWSKTGQLIYERPMDKPVSAWNVHRDKIVFQESVESKQFFILCINQQENFDGSENILNKSYDVSLQRLDVQVELNQKQGQPEDELYQNEYIQYKKIQTTIGIARNKFIFSSGENIYAIDLIKVDQAQVKPNSDDEFVVTVSQDMITRISHSYKRLLSIFNTGNDKTAFMLEDSSRKVVFTHHLGKNDRDQKKQSGKLKVKHRVQKFSFVVTTDERGNFYNTAFILYYNGDFSFFCDFKKVESCRESHLRCLDVETDNNYFYYLTERIDKERNHQQEIVKIAVQLRNKLSQSRQDVVEKKKPFTQKSNSKSVLDTLLCRSNRNLNELDQNIQYTEIHSEQGLKTVVYNRVASYINMYTQFISYNQYLLVSHRNFVTVFNVEEATGVDSNSAKYYPRTYAYSDHILCLAHARRSKQKQTCDTCHLQKKNDDGQVEKNLHTDQIDILVLLGNGQLMTIQQDYENGNDRDNLKFESSTVQIVKNSNNKYKILSFAFNRYEKKGIYILAELTSQAHPKMYNTSGLNKFLNSHKVSNTKKNTTKELFVVNKGQLVPFLTLDKDFNNQNNLQLSTVLVSDAQNTYDETQDQSFSNEILAISCSEKSLIVELKLNADDSLISSSVKTVNHHSQDNSQQQIGLIQYNQIEKSGRKSCKYGRITNKGIAIYQDGMLETFYTNIQITDMVLLDQTYIYIICREKQNPVKQCAPIVDDESKLSEQIANGASILQESSGIYVLDIKSLFTQRVVESYKLDGSENNSRSFLNYSAEDQRVIYLSSFDNLTIMPFPHRNTISFLSMESRSNYLIWREKDGFFTSYHKLDHDLTTWSVLTGKIVHRIPKAKQQALYRDLTQYQVYEANERDSTYTANFQNREKYTIQLLYKQKQPNQGQTDIALQTEAQLNSEQLSSIYSFLVVRLETFEDGNSNHGIKELFEFDFNMGNSKYDKRPYLHISQDLQKLMVVNDFGGAKIYKFEWINQDKQGNSNCRCCSTKVLCCCKYQDTSQSELPIYILKKIANIHHYPSDLQEGCSYPYLFDPNLEKYVDYWSESDSLAIFRVQVNKKKQKPTLISNQLLSFNTTTNFNGQIIKFTKEQIIKQISKRIHFIDSNYIRIVNKEGIDSLLDISDSNDIKIVAFSKIDNLTLQNNFQADHPHFILQKCQLGRNEVFERLVRRNQHYKTQIQYEKFYWHRSRVQKDYKYERDRSRMLSYLGGVDYQSNSPAEESEFIAEQSFNLLDWIIIEKTLKDKQFDFSIINRSRKIQLCFNIFPNSKSALHVLSESYKNEKNLSERVDQTIINLFSDCKLGLSEAQGFFNQNKPIELPILEDVNGMTCIDSALKIKNNRNPDSLFYYQDRNLNKSCRPASSSLFRCLDQLDKRVQFEISSIREVKRNNQLVSIIFDGIKDYSYLHSGNLLYSSVIKAIQQQVPGIGNYLDGRLVSSSHLPDSSYRQIKRQHSYFKTKDSYLNGKNELTQDFESEWQRKKFGLHNSPIWQVKNTFKKQMFKDKGAKRPTIVKYFDIPCLHLNQEEGKDFIMTLQNCPQDYAIDLSAHRSIQILTKAHWQSNVTKIWIFMVIPYFLLIISYTIWSNFVLVDMGEQIPDQADPVLQIALIILSLWFLLIQVMMMFTGFKLYFTKMWNYLLICPLILILWNVSKAHQQIFTVSYCRIEAAIAINLWFNLLYYLRVIERTSHFVTMLMDVIGELWLFLLILGISHVGFSNAFYSLSQGNEYKENGQIFVASYSQSLKYTYMATLGAFDGKMNTFIDDNGSMIPQEQLQNQYDSFTWVVFILATLLNQIILLNLLISIISTIYSRVDSEKYQSFTVNKISLIFTWYTIESKVMVFWEFLVYIHRSFAFCRKGTCCRSRRDQRILNQAIHDLQKTNTLLLVAWEKSEKDLDEKELVADDQKTLIALEEIKDSLRKLQEGQDDKKAQRELLAQIKYLESQLAAKRCLCETGCNLCKCADVKDIKPVVSDKKENDLEKLTHHSKDPESHQSNPAKDHGHRCQAIHSENISHVEEHKEVIKEKEQQVLSSEKKVFVRRDRTAPEDYDLVGYKIKYKKDQVVVSDL